VNLETKTRNYSGTSVRENGFAEASIAARTRQARLCISKIFTLRQQNKYELGQNGGHSHFAILACLS
jgi:hypothetical protein